MKKFVLSLIAGLALMAAPSFAQSVTFNVGSQECGISMHCSALPIEAPDSGTMEFVAAPYHQVVISTPTVSFVSLNTDVPVMTITLDPPSHSTTDRTPYFNTWAVTFTGHDSFGNRLQGRAVFQVYNQYNRGSGRGGGGAGWRKTVLSGTVTLFYMNL